MTIAKKYRTVGGGLNLMKYPIHNALPEQRDSLGFAQETPGQITDKRVALDHEQDRLKPDFCDARSKEHRRVKTGRAAFCLYLRWSSNPLTYTYQRCRRIAVRKVKGTNSVIDRFYNFPSS